MLRKMAALLLLGFICAGPVTGAVKVHDSDDPLMVGASVRDVTPTEENGLLPISTIGTKEKIVGVLNPQHTRIIAFRKGDTRALMICTETGKGPLGDVFAKAISEHTGIPVEAIFYTTTHSHAVPEVVRGDFSIVEGPEDSNELKWARLTLRQMLDGCDEALSAMKPVKAFVGTGESHVATNRNYSYTYEDGTHRRNLGVNLADEMDPALVVLRFDDADGNPVAFIMNYACHAVTMISNTCLDGKIGLDPDFPGQVSRLLEEKYPGAVAMWTSGAAGDQNPFISNQIMYPDPHTGREVTVYAGETMIRDQVAYMHYDDIKNVLSCKMEPLNVDRLAYSEDAAVIPTQEGKPEARLSLQLLRLGDFAFLGSPGEIYSSIGKYIKEHSPLPYTVVVDNTWNWPNSDTTYIEDDRGVEDPGFGGGHFFLPGAVTSGLSGLANELIGRTGL